MENERYIVFNDDYDRLAAEQTLEQENHDFDYDDDNVMITDNDGLAILAEAGIDYEESERNE